MRNPQRLVLLTAMLTSVVVFLDGSIVSIALPAMQESLGGGLALQQWAVDAYLITLGAFVLIAGSLADHFGVRRILKIGLLGFLVTSLACAIATTAPVLIVSRAFQGMAGALLVPSSLALIHTFFVGKAYDKAIGTWTAATGGALLAGPVIGGFLVTYTSWRFIFAMNILPVLLTLLCMRGIHVENGKRKDVRVDIWGAMLCVCGIGGPVFALIELSRLGWHSLLIQVALWGGLSFLVGFLFFETRTSKPMLPAILFRVHNFTAGNLATAAVYGAWTAFGVFIALYLQQVLGFSALKAGLIQLPLTLLLFMLSSFFGGLAGRYGPRWFMTAGPLVMAIGTLSLVLVQGTSGGDLVILVSALVFYGFGIAVTVAPLTAATLGEVSSEHSGIASAINNAIARIAGLVTVAAVGTFLSTEFTNKLNQAISNAHIVLPSGLSQALRTYSPSSRLPPHTPSVVASVLHDALSQSAFSAFRILFFVLALLFVLGSIISAIGISNYRGKHRAA